uniref:Ras-like protein family member 10B n=1 Tax=Anopheles farauti TaxID=69004 RepID=A0A182Q7F7_9DIPT
MYGEQSAPVGERTAQETAVALVVERHQRRQQQQQQQQRPEQVRNPAAAAAATAAQFFRHDFPKEHIRTAKRTVYRSCLVCDTCIRELMVLDVPPQKYFPIDNLAEWNNGHPLGLRTVHTYVLVYDMGNLDTFQYCRNMRDQILESFNHRDFKIMVVGNKVDMVSNPHTQELKDISTLVRKHWRCGYVECSARHNYKIGDIFKELMGYPVGGTAPKLEFSQSMGSKNRCTIL